LPIILSKKPATFRDHALDLPRHPIRPKDGMKSFHNHVQGRTADAARAPPASAARPLKRERRNGSPYEDTQTAAAFIECAPISDTVRAKVCHGNAVRILKL
jgi:hypothetical protein